MISSLVARRYAKALFALGAKKGDAEIEAYGKDLAAIKDVLAAAPEALKVFANPLFKAEEKKAVMEQILSRMQVSPIVASFCGLLGDKDRLDRLPEIADYYGKLLDEAQGVVRGELLTAVALADKRQGEIRETLEKQSGNKLILDFDVNPDILGGVVLKVGDKVLDASLRAQLDILKENIKRGE